MITNQFFAKNGIQTPSISATTYYGNGHNLTGIRTINYANQNTTSDDILLIDTISGITDNSNAIINSYVIAYKDNIDYGFFKRTLAVNKVSGISNILFENSDMDKISSGMTPNNVVYSADSGNIIITIKGETAKNYTWVSNWEVLQ